MGILALEQMFKQLEVWGQDSEDSRFGDLSELVTQNLKWILEESFDWEVRHRTGCSLYERNKGRKDYRNGYRTRDILTRYGRLKDVRVPRLRYSGYVPSLLSPGRLAKDWMVLIAVGIDEDGYKEVIGYTRSKRESASAWRRLLNQLVERGLDYEKLDLVISDDSPAIALAVDDVFGDDVAHHLRLGRIPEQR